MKKLFLFAAAAMMSLSMLAETAKITPTWEANYRTNNAEPTGWTKVTTDAEQFEVYNGARFFAIQTWTIANISKVTSLEFVYQRVSGQTNNGDVSMWVFPYSSMVTSTADYATAGVAFLNDVKTILGVYPGNTIDDDHQPLKISEDRDSISGVHCRVIVLGETEIAALKAAGSVENDYLTVNVLLNTVKATNNYKYYHTGDNASYCTVTYEGEVVVPAIVNNTSKAGYSDLATAVEEATAGDVLLLNEDVTISGSRLEIKKELTIQGATGAEKIICGVAANTLMVLANDNTADYTVTFRNLTVDGQNEVRATQTFDSNNKAKLCFDGVSVINTTYSVVTGDVKCNGGNIVLVGENSFPTGIYLNKNKRVDAKNATHTAENPIRLILSGDYVEDYVVVLNCADPTLFAAVDAADETGWELYKSDSKDELKCRKVEKQATALETTNSELKAQKLIINGQIVIRRGDRHFDLTGREL